MVMMGYRAADKLMHPARNGDDQKSADHGSAYDREPLSGNKSETAHHPHTGRYKEKSKIIYQKIGRLLDPGQPHRAHFESGSEQQHTDDTRRHRDMSEIDNQFAQREKRKQYSTLEDHE